MRIQSKSSGYFSFNTNFGVGKLQLPPETSLTLDSGGPAIWRYW